MNPEEKRIYLSGISSSTVQEIIDKPHHEDRIETLMSIFGEMNKPCQNIKPLFKDEDRAKSLLQKAYNLYLECKTTSQFEECIKTFAESISYAPPKSEQLRQCYLSRSILLFHFKLYEDCQKDIDRILTFDSSEDLEEILQVRKNVEINDKIHSNKYYEQAVSMMVTISGPKSLLPQYSIVDLPVDDKITIKYNKKYGKHAVATSSINPGDILVVEKPYLIHTSPDMRYSHCWHCAKGCFSPIACDHCVGAIYCSEKCKTESWEQYHEIECNIMDYLVGQGLNHSSVRLVIKAVKDAGSIDNLIKLVEDLRTNYDRTESHKEFKSPKKMSTTYSEVYSLLTHYEKRCNEGRIGLMIGTCLVIMRLAATSNFFGKKLPFSWKELARNKHVTFIGGLLFHHRMQCTINDIHYMEERVEGNQLEICPTATAIMPLIASFNHSCDPNVAQISCDTHVCLVASAPIQEGEQIFINNSNILYINQIKRDRQSFLQSYSFFVCKCRACEEDWLPSVFIPSYKLTAAKILHKKLNQIMENYNNVCLYYARYSNFSFGVISKLSEMITNMCKTIHKPCKEQIELQKILCSFYYRIGNRIVYPEPEN